MSILCDGEFCFSSRYFSLWWLTKVCWCSNQCWPIQWPIQWPMELPVGFPRPFLNLMHAIDSMTMLRPLLYQWWYLTLTMVLALCVLQSYCYWIATFQQSFAIGRVTNDLHCLTDLDLTFKIFAMSPRCVSKSNLNLMQWWDSLRVFDHTCLSMFYIWYLDPDLTILWY